MDWSFKKTSSNISFEQSKKNFGLLLFVTFGLLSCNNLTQDLENEKVITYLEPSDSVQYDWSNNSKEITELNFGNIRFGHRIFFNDKNELELVSIDSKNELHRFNFVTSERTYSEPLNNNFLDAYYLDSNHIYLLVNDSVLVKDFNLKAVNSFKYRKPAIELSHGIDFSLENKSNLFKINDYLALMYYVVDENEVYRNTKYLFYYFNEDTAFFANKMPLEQDTSFQYFRNPAVISDDNHIYHSPKTINLISKSNEIKTIIEKRIDEDRNAYLTIRNEDQYQISRLKKFRFSTTYNKNILFDDNKVYLIREFLLDSEVVNGVTEYNNDLEVLVLNENLQELKSYYISNNQYNFAFAKNDELYLFSLTKNKYYVYKL